MKILLTIASTRPSHGGTSRSTPYLANALAGMGAEVHIVTANPSGVGRPGYLSEEVGFHSLEESGWFQRTFRSPFRFRRHLEEVIRRVEPDIIHDQGAWLPSNRAASLSASRHGIPLVVTPRGLLTERAFGRKGWKKRLAWTLYQRRAIARADLIHTTSPHERDHLRKLGVDTPVSLIPNGVELPPDSVFPESGGRAGEGGGDGNGGGEAAAWPRKVLFLSRIDPIKGLPLLLKAWSMADTGDWELEIVGPGEERYVDYIDFRIRRMEDDSVRLRGEVGEEEKWEVYRSAGLFVLPSYSESFGNVIAEALAAGLPVITLKTTPWRDLEDRECGWWIEPELEELLTALDAALSLPDDELRAMGRRGRRLVEEKYSWGQVASRMMDEYNKVIDA